MDGVPPKKIFIPIHHHLRRIEELKKRHNRWVVGAFFEPHAQLVLFSFFEDDLSSVVHFIHTTTKEKKKEKKERKKERERTNDKKKAKKRKRFWRLLVVLQRIFKFTLKRRARKHTHTHTHTHYVCKTYGRNSRSEETGTGRESRDRCHLVRARIRDADVDAFIL